MIKKIQHLLIEIFGKFVATSIWTQFFILSIVSTVIIFIFSLAFDSVGISISFFVDPGFYTGAMDNYPIIGFIETLLGIIIFGAIISLITTSIISIIERNKLKAVHNILEEAFHTVSSIPTRKFIKENELIAEPRNINLDDAEIKLELDQNEIKNAIKVFGDMRLRRIKTTNEIVIENFSSNTPYGTFVNRKSPLTIISTQSFSDAGIGHFSASIANTLNANYISNEYFSSGSMLKSKQINFAVNEIYTKLNQPHSEQNELNFFINDILEIKKHTNLFIYLGTSNASRKHHVHLLSGGEKGDTNFNTSSVSYKDSLNLKNVFDELKENLNEHGYLLAYHDEYNNNNPQHLATNLNNLLKIDTITIYISTSILWDENDLNYFKVLNLVKAAIKKLTYR